MSMAHLTSLAQGALDSPTHREAKRSTQDGLIWPVARAEMRSGRRIRERLAEDAQTLLRKRGPASVLFTEDFLRLGWLRPQLAEHGRAALESLSSENRCGNDALSPEVA
jgi:hypothetical protein